MYREPVEEGEGTGVVRPPQAAQHKRRKDARKTSILNKNKYFLVPTNFKLLGQIKGNSISNCDYSPLAPNKPSYATASI